MATVGEWLDIDILSNSNEFKAGLISGRTPANKVQIYLNLLIKDCFILLSFIHNFEKIGQAKLVKILLIY